MSATENMAYDSLFFDSVAGGVKPALRFYGWKQDCHTCGVFQNSADFLGILPSGTGLVKRPTGGGLVFHEFNDITYALVVPSSHAFFSLRPRDSYAEIHRLIAFVAKEYGVDAALSSGFAGNEGPMQCFSSPVSGDLVSAGGEKSAGAAQKRSRSGFLLQGSIKMPQVSDRAGFQRRLAEELACLLGGCMEESGVELEPGAWAERLKKFSPVFV